jgi:hypothetical protein
VFELRAEASSRGSKPGGRERWGEAVLRLGSGGVAEGD